MSEYKRNHKLRMSGILAHPSSFPSRFGIGDFGPQAYEFIDFLVRSNQTLWQVLPFGPTGYGDSPYQSFSSFAGQTLFISPELLIKEDLLSETDLQNIPVWFDDKIDYGSVIYYKNNLYQLSYDRFSSLPESHPLCIEFNEFCNSSKWWLNDYALFMALKKQQQNRSWLEWDISYRCMNEYTRNTCMTELSDSIRYQKYLQFLFYRQWYALKAYANDHGIFLIGDIPIFVALDGSDTWANQSIFKLNEEGFPIDVSGVPPDYFSSTGQLWGNPLYRWDVLKEQNYDWWIRRIRHQLTIFDYLRIDHFRGFDAYWAVPFGEKTAVNGRWEKGPGKDFFYTLQNAFGSDLPIFAEDLGVITPEVEDLRDTFHFPGMKILQFGLEDFNDNAFLPHNYPYNCVCYSGTHDNDTTRSWYEHLNPDQKQRMNAYCNADGTNPAWDLIRLSLASPANYSIQPIWDLLNYGNEARMNMPGTSSNNWLFRFSRQSLSSTLSDKLAFYTHLYGRS